MIELYKVTVEINNKSILKDISLSISSGEKIALIGPSGAGKTTLLNLLCKQQTKFTGSISINNKNIREYNESRKYANEVGIIRQQFDLIEPLSVINNVLAGRLKDWSFLKSFKSLIKPVEKEIAINALELVKMEDHIYSETQNLSGGEKQRVAIARLLVQNPKIVLADEPVASLDPVLSKQIIELLKNNTKNKTLVVSIHDVELALTYFDRIIGLKNGKIEFDKKTLDINGETIKLLYER